VEGFVLWKITGTNVYLVGSLHVGDTELVVPDKILMVVREARNVAFECNFAEVSHSSFMQHCSLQSGLASAVSPSLFAAVEVMAKKYGLDFNTLSGLQPFAVTLQIGGAVCAEQGITDQVGIDKSCLNLAKQNPHSRIFYLEKFYDALIALGINGAEQAAQLEYLLLRTPEYMDRIFAIIKAFKDNQPELLLQLRNESDAMFPISSEAMLGRRNAKWLPQIQRFIAGGKSTVVVVGALHLVGRGSLPDLLSRLGYSCDFVG
jgi:uncharacterized protein YbaP (TraB family)